jgi:hypothetical protein
VRQRKKGLKQSRQYIFFDAQGSSPREHDTRRTGPIERASGNSSWCVNEEGIEAIEDSIPRGERPAQPDRTGAVLEQWEDHRYRKRRDIGALVWRTRLASGNM